MKFLFRFRVKFASLFSPWNLIGKHCNTCYHYNGAVRACLLKLHYMGQFTKNAIRPCSPYWVCPWHVEEVDEFFCLGKPANVFIEGYNDKR